MSSSNTISTHVLDTSLGAPAANVTVTLLRIDDRGESATISSHVTNDDGRVSGLVSDGEPLRAGRYRLSFDVAGYFAASHRETFYSTIAIDFKVGDGVQHYHVPLLLSPFGYSTYRGS